MTTDQELRIFALLSEKGTACAETALVSDEDTPKNRAAIDAMAQREQDAGVPDPPVPGTWTDVTDNDAIREACNLPSLAAS